VPYLTPNEDSEGGFDSRPLYIPRAYTPIVTGALFQLLERYNWEQFGDITIDRAIEDMQTMLDGYLRGNTMIGAIIPYATADIPANALPCDGSTYARVDYPDLYAALDASFVIDADNFITPNLNNRFPLGASTNIGETGGEATHTLTIDEIPSHAHEIPYESCFPYGTTPEVCVVGGLLKQNTSAVGGGQAHNNMPPYIKLRYGIVYR